jgi:hypothetical protein
MRRDAIWGLGSRAKIPARLSMEAETRDFWLRKRYRKRF